MWRQQGAPTHGVSHAQQWQNISPELSLCDVNNVTQRTACRPPLAQSEAASQRTKAHVLRQIVDMVDIAGYPAKARRFGRRQSTQPKANAPDHKPLNRWTEEMPYELEIHWWSCEDLTHQFGAALKRTGWAAVGRDTAHRWDLLSVLCLNFLA